MPDNNHARLDLQTLRDPVMDRLGIAVLLISPEKKILYANRSARRFLGVGADALLGCPDCRELIKLDICNGECPASRISGEEEIIEDHFVARRDEGKVYWVSTAILGDPLGRGSSVVHAIKDMDGFMGMMDKDVPAYLQKIVGRLSTKGDLMNRESKRIIAALEKNNWKVGKTASSLGYSRVTLWRRMKKLRIELPNRDN